MDPKVIAMLEKIKPSDLVNQIEHERRTRDESMLRELDLIKRLRAETQHLSNGHVIRFVSGCNMVTISENGDVRITKENVVD